MIHHNMSLGRMLGYLYRRAQGHFNREFVRLGLNGGIHSFLMFLYRHDGLTQQELSESLHFDKAHTTRVIHRLIDLGYVVKRRNPFDQRSYRIYLTEKARVVRADIHRVLHNWTDRLARGFSSRERKQLVDMLARMIENLDDNGRETG